MRSAKSTGIKNGNGPNRRDALAAGAVGITLLASGAATPDLGDNQAIGPVLGHVDNSTAIIWYRPSEPGQYAATLFHDGSGIQKTIKAITNPENDRCLKFRFDNLNADTEYRYTISDQSRNVCNNENQRIKTAPETNRPSRTILAMGSCASSTEFFDVWDQIAKQNIDALMLLGDTPYIDNTSIEINRKRHQEFLSIPSLAKLGTSTPIWGTWDDHDFGGNDTDGKIGNKQAIRKVFTEYRAQTQFGDGQHGIYTNFRRGCVEVFMLDPRYFSQTEPSTVDASKPTCLGKRQWQWLCKVLRDSTAPFKLLVTGMIWDDKKNGEKDDWGTYAHEREAIFDFIGKHKIGGVILIGGDIHVSRHLKYPMKERIGYDLHQFIVSPLHDRVIPSLNEPDPHLQWGQPIKNVFMTITADSNYTKPRLDANWIDRTGKNHRHVRIELDS